MAIKRQRPGHLPERSGQQLPIPVRVEVEVTTPTGPPRSSGAAQARSAGAYGPLRSQANSVQYSHIAARRHPGVLCVPADPRRSGADVSGDRCLPGGGRADAQGPRPGQAGPDPVRQLHEPSGAGRSRQVHLHAAAGDPGDWRRASVNTATPFGFGDRLRDGSWACCSGRSRPSSTAPGGITCSPWSPFSASPCLSSGSACC